MATNGFSAYRVDSEAHNMSGDPEQEYFADGMVEDTITEVSRFQHLFVIARNTWFTYKGRSVDVK
jgi:TolB-like protein